MEKVEYILISNLQLCRLYICHSKMKLHFMLYRLNEYVRKKTKITV